MAPIRPKFRNPPLVERAITVCFKNLDGFSIGDYGLFWSRIRDDFTESQTAPRVDHVLETPERAAPLGHRVEEASNSLLPRAFFRNIEKGELIQVQPDRFSFNWLKATPNHSYPHSDMLFKRFFTLLAEFAEVVDVRGIGPIIYDQCEITNVNVISLADVGTEFTDIATLIKSADLGDMPSCIKLEGQLVGATYLLLGRDGDPCGRVYSLGQPSWNNKSDEPAFRLDITARGAPRSNDLEGVKIFFECAADAVNAAFLTAITTGGRKFWGEIDG